MLVFPLDRQWVSDSLSSNVFSVRQISVSLWKGNVTIVEYAEEHVAGIALCSFPFPLPGC